MTNKPKDQTAASLGTDSSPGEDDVLRGAGGRSILERFHLHNRNALVTGAGQGIGRAFAHALGEAGAALAVVDIDQERADRVAQELNDKNVDAIAIGADAGNIEHIERFVSDTVDHFGALHIAVNNAGINRNAAAEHTAVEEWDATFALNTRGVFLACQVEGRIMLEAGYGKIINTASMASLIVPHPQKQAAYNVSKAAVAHLTRSLAAEWADRGVRVNAISPGIIRTALIEQSPDLAPLMEEWIAAIPANRLGEVTDLQAGIVYLACEASDYMTGHNLVIEGGQTLW